MQRITRVLTLLSLYIFFYLPFFAQNIHVHRIEGGAVSENAYVLESRTNLYLIDALLSTKDAEALADTIGLLEKTLQLIFITHGHPDHFQGLAAIYQKSPNTLVGIIEYRGNATLHNHV